MKSTVETLAEAFAQERQSHENTRAAIDKFVAIILADAERLGITHGPGISIEEVYRAILNRLAEPKVA
jgi:hypothetical protein